jgi:hypothetical protein
MIRANFEPKALGLCIGSIGRSRPRFDLFTITSVASITSITSNGLLFSIIAGAGA